MLRRVREPPCLLLLLLLLEVVEVEEVVALWHAWRACKRGDTRSVTGGSGEVREEEVVLRRRHKAHAAHMSLNQSLRQKKKCHS